MTDEIQVIRLPALLKKMGLSKSTIWARLDPKNRRYDPAFPKPFKISAGAVGWLESEVNAYIQKLAESRHKEGKA